MTLEPRKGTRFRIRLSCFTRDVIVADSAIRSFADLAEQLVELPTPHRLVAIDGTGGAGKSTFAERLVRSMPPSTLLLRTDDFARPDQPIDWWPRLLEVIECLAAGKPATFEPYDWSTNTLLPRRPVEPAEIVLIEGVSSSRRAWSDHLQFSIWLEASADVCQQRGIARDGVTRDQWDREAGSERAFFERDDAKTRADLAVDATATGFDPETLFAVLHT